MILNIGSTGDPLHKINKNITFPEGLSLSGDLKEDCDICDPVCTSTFFTPTGTSF